MCLGWGSGGVTCWGWSAHGWVGIGYTAQVSEYQVTFGGTNATND